MGDSNTRLLHFGDGKGTFVKWMSGNRLEAFHIEDIPDPVKIGPYSNVIIHTGATLAKFSGKFILTICDVLFL